MDEPFARYCIYKTYLFSSEFDKTQWCCSIVCILQLQQVSLNSVISIFFYQKLKFQFSRSFAKNSALVLHNLQLKLICLMEITLKCMKSYQVSDGSIGHFKFRFFWLGKNYLLNATFLPLFDDIFNILQCFCTLYLVKLG